MDFGAYMELRVDRFLHFMDHPEFGGVEGDHLSKYTKKGHRVSTWNQRHGQGDKDDQIDHQPSFKHTRVEKEFQVKVGSKILLSLAPSLTSSLLPLQHKHQNQPCRR